VRYEPPENLSPAIIRYVYTMTSDGRSYAAIIAQLAARKLLAIIPDPEKGVVTLQKLVQDRRDWAQLAPEEKRVFKGPFRVGRPGAAGAAGIVRNRAHSKSCGGPVRRQVLYPQLRLGCSRAGAHSRSHHLAGLVFGDFRNRQG
jgi:hypothetical protein